MLHHEGWHPWYITDGGLKWWKELESFREQNSPHGATCQLDRGRTPGAHQCRHLTVWNSDRVRNRLCSRPGLMLWLPGGTLSQVSSVLLLGHPWLWVFFDCCFRPASPLVSLSLSVLSELKLRKLKWLNNFLTDKELTHPTSRRVWERGFEGHTAILSTTGDLRKEQGGWGMETGTLFGKMLQHWNECLWYSASFREGESGKEPWQMDLKLATNPGLSQT